MTPIYIRSNLRNQRNRVFSLTATVAEMVKERGTATVDDLLPHLPEFSRKQVMGALQNASDRGRLECEGNGRVPGKFRPATGQKERAHRPAKPVPRRVASVWDLGRLQGDA